MFWYDRQLIDAPQLHLDLNDPGLCYGATSFTTMRVYDKFLNHPFTSWLAHCDRLKTSLLAFGWQQPDWQQLRQGAEILAEFFPVLRMAIFPDGREWITGRNLPANLEEFQTTGITAWVAQDSLYRRDLPQYKTGNYLSAYLARNQAISRKAQEAILVDTQGNWLETSTGNLWGWKNDCWYTPGLDSGILAGIARSRWLDFCQSRKIKVIENIWHPEFISTLEAIAYSNCVVDWLPIKTVINGAKTTSYMLKQLE
ncbi:4-amino-4-deoxychorismate lyase [Pleurocapsa sp. CCALA 161]|uniref:aminotransferase class IV n=1 Tax=Pleurocapsa sp. CCALA 161 TaxID=2107688 RepID=UPI000D0704D0|nr:aminotransferase class IV [Pleurocapsa sp. CCALA 161]PSB10502.1 4-amino-4-deoxychorismate lyase [Pleurocapsa sp. CCALA 161]